MNARHENQYEAVSYPCCFSRSDCERQRYKLSSPSTVESILIANNFSSSHSPSIITDMSDLPTELWNDIFAMSCDPPVPVVLNIARGIVSSADPLLAIPVVSRRWRDIASSLRLGPFKLLITDSTGPHQPLTGRPSIESTARTLERWLARFRDGCLNVTCRFSLDDGSMYRPQLCVVQSLFSHRNRWGDMDLDIRPFIQEEFGAAILQDGLPQLRRLSLRYPPFHDDLYPVILALGKCPLLRDAAFINTFPYTLIFSNLKSFTLILERMTAPLDFDSLFWNLSTAHKLRSLTLDVHRSDVVFLTGLPDIILPHLRSLHLTSLSFNFFRFIFEHLVARKLSTLTIISHIAHAPGSLRQGLGIMVWDDDITETLGNFLWRSRRKLRELHFNFDTRVPSLPCILSLLPNLTSLSWPLPPTGNCSDLHLRFDDDAEGGRKLVSGSCPKLESMTFYPGFFDDVSIASDVLEGWLEMLESRWDNIPEGGVDVARLREVKAEFLTSDVPLAVSERFWRLKAEGLKFNAD